MKPLLCLILFLLMVSSTALADNFQISFSQGGASAYVAYSSVRIFDANNKQVFSGSTDRYGRIIINIPTNGSYRIEIDFKSKTCRKAISIDHSTPFKIISLVPADLALNSVTSPSFTCLSSFHQLFYSYS